MKIVVSVYVSPNYCPFIDCWQSLLQFLLLCRLFSVAHEHRLHAGVVKMPRVSNAFEDYTSL